MGHGHDFFLFLFTAYTIILRAHRYNEIDLIHFSYPSLYRSVLFTTIYTVHMGDFEV